MYKDSWVCYGNVNGNLLGSNIDYCIYRDPKICIQTEWYYPSTVKVVSMTCFVFWP